MYTPPSTPQNFTEKGQIWDIKTWNKVLFSDEKDINLDGPDRFQRYRHDKTFWSGVGSMMIWFVIFFQRTMELQIIQERQAAAGYISMLDRESL